MKHVCLVHRMEGNVKGEGAGYLLLLQRLKDPDKTSNGSRHLSNSKLKFIKFG